MGRDTVVGDTLYRKVGRRYVKVHDLWRGNPADGIWLIMGDGHGHHSALMCRVGEVPDALPLAAMMQHIDAAARAVLEFWAGENPDYDGRCKVCTRPAAYSVAQAVLKAVAKEGA